MSDVSRADADRERDYSNEKTFEESQAGAVPRNDVDNESSIDSLQDGVKGIESISQAWDKTSLIVAYCRYVCVSLSGLQLVGRPLCGRGLTSRQSSAYGLHHIDGGSSHLAGAG